MRKIIVPRLSGWLVASVVLFALIGWTSSAQIPVVIYKLSPVSLSAVLGYWLDRSLFPGTSRLLLPLGRIAVLRRGDDSSRDHRCGNLPCRRAGAVTMRYQYVCPVCAMTFLSADAAEPPRASLQWRNEVIRTAREIWGLTPPLLILPGNYIRNPAGRLTRFLRLARRVWRNLCLRRQNG